MARRQVTATAAERSKLSARIARQYQEGASIRNLAAEHGCSYGFVRGLLIEEGAALRSRGGYQGRKPKA